jgi:dienelactone hydrolase
MMKTSLCAMAAALILASAAARAETVYFPSGAAPPTPLQERLARERGEIVERRKGDDLVGELHRPPGAGPFPAVVLLHGCSGRSTRTWEDPAAARYVELGYVTLIVDSFATRGLTTACTGGAPDRVMDAYGGLNYLAGLPFVKPDRIGVIGFSQGAMAALSAVAVQGVETLVERHFAVAVAYYPSCSDRDGAFTVPTLILIGERDDWTPARDCREMMARRTGEGASVKLVIYPGAYHSFNSRSLRDQPKTLLGHHLEYDAAADDAAWQEMTALLRRTLGP